MQLVVTSREPLGIHGETVWFVPPLAYDEAIALFIERAQAAAASRLGRRHRSDRRHVRAVEGIPLAIELAAVRVPALGVAQVRELMTDRLGFLSRGHRLDSSRHQTLRAALDWSYALLDTPEQRLFAHLAVFAGGWSLDAAQAVCGWAEGSAVPVVEPLVGLVEKSLVLAETTDGLRRYRFLETIREYAADQLVASA